MMFVMCIDFTLKSKLENVNLTGWFAVHKTEMPQGPQTMNIHWLETISMNEGIPVLVVLVKTPTMFPLCKTCENLTEKCNVSLF